MRRRQPLLLLLALAATASPAAGERLVSALSNQEVEISSSFTGERITLFGSIEPDAGSEARVRGPFHIIVVVEGPLSNRVARQQGNRLGIWSNVDEVVFTGFPSYYRVLASDRLLDIAGPAVLANEEILPEERARRAAQTGWWRAAVFSRELVRLMTEKGFLGVDEQGVQFLSDTAYSARLTLPSDITPGAFVAHTYLFRDGQIIAERVEGFTVRKVGFERFVGNSARQWPLLYGIVCVLLALGTGWLGGVVFRR